MKQLSQSKMENECKRKHNKVLVASGWWLIWTQSKCNLEGGRRVIMKLMLLDSNAVIKNHIVTEDNNS